MRQTLSVSLDLKSPRFSYTSTKYCLLQVAVTVSLKLVGRQTLHTQWFQRFPLTGYAVRCQFGRLGPPFAGHAGSPNVTCVQWNRSGLIQASLLRHLPTRQTLRVCVQRVSGKLRPVNLDLSEATKRYARNGFCVFAACSRNALKTNEKLNFSSLSLPN